MCSRVSRAPIALAAVAQTICLAGIATALSGCGGGSSSPSTSPASTNYTVGGSVSGLIAGSLVLANGTATVTVAAGATSWVFPTTFVAGSSYSVTVQTQPVNEVCAVTAGGSGMNTGDVSNVAVTCSYGQWAWESGSNAVNALGVYGTQGTAAAGNAPGARFSACSWTDSSGHFWLFGGVGDNSGAGAGYLNDLWEYSPSAGQWTWVGGSNADNATGVYGTEGTAATGNVPGARQAASCWTDSSGNLWLLGGYGYAASGTAGYLNDLWRYNPGAGQWTWVGGSNADNAAGVYGTEGTAAAGNSPGARQAALSWVDGSGNVWLFGGTGYASTGGVGNLNDLWRYSPSTGLWTWVGGGNTDNATGIYGTQGTAAASNLPGARYAASSWIDSSGNLWLFGGYGYDSTGTPGKLNDLWRYSTSSGQWTWVGGEDAVNFEGVYGTLATAAVGNSPGARQAANTWVDASGKLWMFGGSGFDGAGHVGSLNDLWQYSPSSAEWTWFGGSTDAGQTGTYGTLGTAAPANLPGARQAASAWTDSSGHFWLFGGEGDDGAGNSGYLGDLWQYAPGAGE